MRYLLLTIVFFTHASLVAANPLAPPTGGSGGGGSGDMTKAVYDTGDDGAADTANALAANGTNCTPGNYPLGIDAAGNVESCTTASGAGDMIKAVYDTNDDGTVDSSDTATALAANGGNCSTGNSPLGVDASGAVESCFDVWTEAENTAAGYGTGDFVGPAGATDNAVMRYDGVTGKLSQDSGVTLDDSDLMTWPATAGAGVLLPLENDAATPTLGFGDGGEGFYQPANDQVGVAIGGARKWIFAATQILADTTAGAAIYNETTSGTNPTLIPRRNDSDTGVGSSALDQLSLIAGGVEFNRMTETSTGAGQTVASYQHQFNGQLGADTGDEAAFYFPWTCNKLAGDCYGVVIDLTSTSADNYYPFVLKDDTSTIISMRENGDTVFPLNNDAATPTIAFGDGDSGFYEQADDTINLSLGGGTYNWSWNTTAFSAYNASGGQIRNEAASATNPTLIPSRGDTDTGMGTNTGDQLSLIAGGVEGIRLTETGGVIDIDLNGYIDQSVCHGELYETNGSTAITITTAGTYYQWVNSTVGEESGNGYVDCDATTDDCTIESATCAGLYMINLHMSFNGNNSAVVNCAIAVDDAEGTKIMFERTLGTAAAVGSASAAGFLTLANGEAVTVECTSDSNGDTVTPAHVNMTMHKVN